MWAAKLPGEGAALYDACVAMCDIMSQLGVAVDGGKDSLSMAARVGGETVKAPGTLVVSTYAPCPDVRKVVTPDLKAPALGKKGVLLYVDLSAGKSRLGGSALAQAFRQLGRWIVKCKMRCHRLKLTFLLFGGKTCSNSFFKLKINNLAFI